MPVISVVVPVYNVEKYLHRCVDSILAQTFTDFELILVDDGSLDNCGTICDEYAKKVSRIHVIHKENGGLSDARNAGIDWAFTNSDSEWITFIDSDDWIHPKYLEALYDAVKHTGCSLSICDFIRTENEKPDVDEKQINPVFYNSEDFYCEKNINAVIAVCKLYKKTDFQDIRYPIGKLHEDEFTTYKLLFQYESVAFVDARFYYYFVNPEGITQSSWNPKRMAMLDAISEQNQFFRRNGFENAYNYNAERLGKALCGYIKVLNNSESYRSYKNVLRKQLRDYIREYKNTLNINIKTYPWFYEYAYPYRMAIYWKIKNLIDK